MCRPRRVSGNASTTLPARTANRTSRSPSSSGVMLHLASNVEFAICNLQFAIPVFPLFFLNARRVESRFSILQLREAADRQPIAGEQPALELLLRSRQPHRELDAMLRHRDL